MILVQSAQRKRNIFVQIFAINLIFQIRIISRPVKIPVIEKEEHAAL